MLVTCPFCHNDTMAQDCVNTYHLKCTRCHGFGVPPTKEDLEAAFGPDKLFDEKKCARLDCVDRGRCPANCRMWKAAKTKWRTRRSSSCSEGVDVDNRERFKADIEACFSEVADILHKGQLAAPTPEEALADLLSRDWTGHHDDADCPGCLLGGLSPARRCVCGAGFIHATRAPDVTYRGETLTIYNVGCWHCGGYEAMEEKAT